MRAYACGFEERLFVTPFFTLYGLYRSAPSGMPGTLRVYIEGDGRAWLSRSRVSDNPTPHNPVALRLALGDCAQEGAVLYLARPCQYVQGDAQRNCAARYWTDARLASEVAAALNHAVDQAKAQSQADQVCLIGFSGGGGAAALMAAQRRDVVFLGTAAGNLDTDAWTDFLEVSPLINSLNPINAAAATANIPQRHLSSRDDKIMPPEISAAFCRASGHPENCIVIDGLEHGGNWEEVWNYSYE
ncbi:MAG: hypothetical protein IJD04_04705 [Desulfovibrionaceae bacterium]|nr:hypothetical protein [Desulfovibrionaceae bacterium]